MAHTLGHNLDVRTLWWSCECASETNREEKNMLIKIIILVSFAYTKYSRRFIKIHLNHYDQILFNNSE